MLKKQSIESSLTLSNEHSAEVKAGDEKGEQLRNGVELHSTSHL